MLQDLRQDSGVGTVKIQNNPSPRGAARCRGGCGLAHCPRPRLTPAAATSVRVCVSVISRGRAEGDLRPSPEAHPGAAGRSPLLLAAVPCVVRTGELASAFTPEGRPGRVPFLAATNKAAASVCVRDFV